MKLYLIGMMGCGKSTCGALLRDRLGLPLLDTDQAIERRTGRTINEIFAEQGEDWFRDRETALLRELARGSESLIVACGGGMPLRAENRELMRQSGRVIFLCRDPARIYDSLDPAARPLAREGKAAFFRRYEGRKPLYEAAAHHIIGDFASPEETAEAILEAIKEEPV